MSDPLGGMKTTICSHCEDHFPVQEFAWSDSDELISDYYARHLKSASPTDRWWCGNGGLACLAILGLLLGVVITIVASLLVGATVIVAMVVGIVLALGGAIGGVVVREAVLAKRILRRVCGVDDPRFLR